jgi:hypothetical protein
VSRPPLEVADLIRSAGAAFLERNRQWLSWKHIKVLLAIARCRTAALGGHDQCTRCGQRATMESERFDRVGVRGRIAVLSLAAVHDDLADSWARAAAALKDARRLSDEDTRRLCWLDAFGALIANTDRHQYNILFFTEGSQLRLAPAFDQVSMLYAPTADGQVPPRHFMLPPATVNTLEVWEDAREAARQFWERGSEDMRLSDDARMFCASNIKLFAP